MNLEIQSVRILTKKEEREIVFFINHLSFSKILNWSERNKI